MLCSDLTFLSNVPQSSFGIVLFYVIPLTAFYWQEHKYLNLEPQDIVAPLTH